MLIASRFRCPVGKRRKAAPGSAAFQPCSTSGHGVQRPAGFPFRSTNGAAAPGEVWAAARQTGPRRAAPLVLLYAVFATHPQRGEYSRPPLAPAVIAPQHRRLAVTSSISLVFALWRKLVHFAVPALPNGSLIRWEPFYGWRVPQGSPASPWEGVSKFHYPPRCRRARPATAGSKVRVDRSVRSLFTSSELPSWRRAFCRYSRGFCAWNTVYSVVGGRDLSLLTYQAGYKHNSQAVSANSPKEF